MLISLQINRVLIKRTEWFRKDKKTWIKNYAVHEKCPTMYFEAYGSNKGGIVLYPRSNMKDVEGMNYIKLWNLETLSTLPWNEDELKDKESQLKVRRIQEVVLLDKNAGARIRTFGLVLPILTQILLPTNVVEDYRNLSSSMTNLKFMHIRISKTPSEFDVTVVKNFLSGKEDLVLILEGTSSNIELLECQIMGSAFTNLTFLDHQHQVE
uniref:SLC12 domain-containing protein n=1 Tax=Parastrongyloides trichosuri TaxID=131310 RepID=A0A0N5A399_PARTI